MDKEAGVIKVTLEAACHMTALFLSHQDPGTSAFKVEVDF